MIFTTLYVHPTQSNGTLLIYIRGLEIVLLSIVLQQMNMTFILVPTTENFQTEKCGKQYSYIFVSINVYYIIVNNVGNIFLLYPYFSSANSDYIMTRRWNVPCSDKHRRWSNFFQIVSMELWLVLIISIGIVAISTTLVARYSCRYDWQGYKTLKSSFTNNWAVILRLSLSTLPHTPSLISLFLATVCFFWLSDQCSRHSSKRFLLSPPTKRQLSTWMSFSTHVLNLPTHKITINFSR